MKPTAPISTAVPLSAPRQIHQAVGILAIASIFAGMFFSEALMSIGMGLLLANTLLNRELPAIWRRFLRHPALLGLAGIFLLYLCSGLYTDDTAFLLRRLRLSLPLLILPLGILSVPRFDRRWYYSVLYTCLWITTLFCLQSLWLFLQDIESITSGYQEGKVLPTPIMHIRFSLLVAYCAAIGWKLFTDRFVWKYAWERWLILALSVFLFLFLHLLAVRSGLLAIYGVLLFLLARETIRRKQYIPGIAALATLSIAILLAFRFVPTLRHKLGYTRYSIERFLKQEDIDLLSDSQRLGSIMAGLDLIRRHPLTGVGIGDIRNECEAYYQAKIPALSGSDLMPHNQYLFAGAATGLFGLLYFAWATCFPIFYRKARHDFLIVAFHIIFISSFLVEHTLESQLGLGLYLFFFITAYRYHEEALTS